MTIATNDITGDEIKSRTSDHKAYGEGWDNIFNKGKDNGGEEKEENPEAQRDGS